MKEPFFSIIVPVYNVEKYLKECIDSVLSQSIDDYELILVNDGSTDKSRDICEEYAKEHENIKIITKDNGGLSSARNVGIRKAVGEYLLFLDSDDFWSSYECLSALKGSVKTYPDFVMFKAEKYFGNKSVDSYGDYDLNLINTNTSDGIFLYMVKNNKQLACAWNKMIRRDYLLDHNIFFVEGITGEDIDWVIRLFQNAKSICAINDILYMYRQNRSGSITNTISPATVRNLYNTIKNVAGEYKKKNSEFDNAVKSFMAFEYSILLYTYPLCRSAITEAEIREYEWLLDYAIDKKSIAIRTIYKLFGFNISMRIFDVIRKIR